MSAIDSLSNKDDEVVSQEEELDLEDGDSQVDEAAPEEKKKKSLKDNLPYIAIGSLIVLGAGYGALNVFMKKPQAPQMMPMDAVVAPVDGAQSGGLDPNAANFQLTPAEQTGQAPVADGQLTNQGGMPSNMPIDQIAQPAPMGQAADPSGQALNQGAMPVAGQSAQGVPPAPTEFAGQAPVAATVGAPQAQPIAVPMQPSLGSDSVSMRMDTDIRQIKDAVVNLNERVTVLENGRTTKASSGSSRASGVVDSASQKPKPSKQRTEKAQKSSDFVRLEDESRARTSTESKTASCDHYAVYALKDGRAWVKTLDGDTQTVVAGGSIGGMKVQSIDEMTGIIKTSSCLIK